MEARLIMHELAMADGLLSVMLEAARGRTVRFARLRIGRLHAVVPDSLQFSFHLLGEGTVAASAHLELEEIPVAVQCERCETISDCPRPPFQCSRCGTTDVSVVSGAELEVVELGLADGTSVILHKSKTLSDTIARHLAEEHGL
jgi:hydrogenase nickel incorporation protein HypA/HybF